MRRVPPSLLLLCLLGACTRAEEVRAPATAKPAGTAEGVQVAAAARAFLEVGAVQRSVPGAPGAVYGRVAFRPRALSSASAPFAGRIASVAVEPGREVAAGAPLFALESAEVAALRAALEQARLKVRIAEEALARQEEMARRGVGLEIERLEAQFRAREARAELERSEKSAALAGEGRGTGVVVRAPVAGVVVSVRAAAGATVQPGGEPLVEIGDLRGLWIVADVPEAQALHVRPGQAAEVVIPALDRALPARVAGVAPRSDAETRRTPVYVEVPGAPAALRAGMLARVTLAPASAEPGLWLPATAVLLKDGRRVVYVEDGTGRFVPRTVQTGEERGGRVRILKGLEEGERVVLRGALLVDREAEQLL